MERRDVEQKLDDALKTIEQQKRVLSELQSERMDALQLAKEWKHKAAQGGSDFALQEENTKLRIAIRDMRLAMENVRLPFYLCFAFLFSFVSDLKYAL